MFGICKACSERYYFDFQFECIAVSPFCQTYDANSGDCTSCYGGYQLTNNGDCTVVPFSSTTLSYDMLTDSCKRYNLEGQCIQCQPNFNELPETTSATTTSSSPAVNCIQKILSNSYCLVISTEDPTQC